MENEFFSRSGKNQEILWMVREFRKIREKSGNLKIKGFRKVIYSFQEGKRCTFS